MHTFRNFLSPVSYRPLPLDGVLLSNPNSIVPWMKGAVRVKCSRGASCPGIRCLLETGKLGAGAVSQRGKGFVSEILGVFYWGRPGAA